MNSLEHLDGHAAWKSGDGLQLMVYAAASALLPYAAAVVLLLLGQD